LSAREELLSLTKELRAHLEWQVETGVTGLPAAVSLDRQATVAAREASASQLSARAFPPPEARSLAPEPAMSPAPNRSLTPNRSVTANPSVAANPSLAANQAQAGASNLGQRQPPETMAVGAPSAAPIDVPRTLAVLAEEVSGCTRCALHATRKHTVFARGNPAADLCFIGEGPGADEDEQGMPFVGKAGQLLDRMIAAMGYARDDVYICNVVKCRPPENRKPEPAEMAACAPFLRKQLELVSPKVMVALGATAVEGLLGTTGGGITRLRGQWKLYRTIPLMPTFHPAYLLRNPLAKREVWADLQAVLKQLGRSAPPARGG
jgi:uracil-DNA glycosylase family 4